MEHSLRGPGSVPRDQILGDATARDKWAKWSLITLSAAAALSVTLWLRHQRHGDFSVQPETGGASVSMSGNF